LILAAMSERTVTLPSVVELEPARALPPRSSAMASDVPALNVATDNEEARSWSAAISLHRQPRHRRYNLTIFFRLSSGAMWHHAAHDSQIPPMTSPALRCSMSRSRLVRHRRPAARPIRSDHYGALTARSFGARRQTIDRRLIADTLRDDERVPFGRRPLSHLFRREDRPRNEPAVFLTPRTSPIAMIRTGCAQRAAMPRARERPVLRGSRDALAGGAAWTLTGAARRPCPRLREGTRPAGAN
jgi:hypothetical protein